MRKAATVVAGLAALLLVAAVPDALVVDDDHVALRPSAIVDDVSGYLRGFATGEVLTYHERWYDRDLLPRVADRVPRSFFYLALSGLSAVTIGVAAGMWVTARRKDGVREVMTAMAVVPDFVVALLLQLAVVAVYRWSGFRVARVASLTAAEPAVLLPLLTLTLVPAVSVLRTVSTRAHLAAAEDHTLVAKGQGMSRRRIYLTRIMPLVLTFVRADLPRLAGTMLGNLFIVEYLFNVRGVTTFVFTRGLFGGYQYNLVMSALLMTSALYAALYLLLRTYVGVLERLAARS